MASGGRRASDNFKFKEKNQKTTPKKWPEPAPSSISIIRHTVQISLFMQWILQNPLDYVTAMRSTSFWFRVTFLGLLFWYDFIAFEHAPLFTLLDLSSCFRAGLEFVNTWPGSNILEATKMTRRAFLALRVIQRQGKSSFNMLVKNWCKWFTKMKISQDLWIRFTPDQFCHHPQVKSYPGMYSLCSSMRFRKSYQWE